MIISTLFDKSSQLGSPNEVSVARAKLTQELCQNLEESSNFLGLRCSSYAKVQEQKLRVKQSSTVEPIVLFPGLGGSRLEGRWHKTHTPSWFCVKNRKTWYPLWLELAELVVQQCWFSSLDIDYNKSTNSFNNKPGVEIQPIDFGGFEGINYLAHEAVIGDVSASNYFGTFIKAFEKAGYNSTNMAGAPYDWRVPTTQIMSQGYLQKVKNLVEKLYTTNGNTPVHLISHSMGGITVGHFLNKVSTQWKQKYIASFIPISSPFSGSPKALRSILSGGTFGIELKGIDILKRENVKHMARQAGGIIELIPSTNHWPLDKKIVKTPSRDFTVRDYQSLFSSAETDITYDAWEPMKDFLYQIEAPHVPVHCIYGNGVETEDSYTYKTDDMSDQPEITFTKFGDGTVTLNSLEECIQWKSAQTESVTAKEYLLRDHQGILVDNDVINYILSITTH